jgi:CPW-WPC domain-containing protein
LPRYAHLIFVVLARCLCHGALSGACSPDLSKNCPLGWHEDVNHDCLAPVAYSGQCVGRKNFRDMAKSEKQLWTNKCDVAWLAPSMSLQSDANWRGGAFPAAGHAAKL